MAPFAAAFWGDPTAELKVVGVTGTNGKTTTAFLVREILEAAGIQTGLMGTVKQVVGGVEEAVERTTPEAIDLQETFRRMLEGGDQACAMEVSSHAMALHRADAIHFDVAAVHQPDPGPPRLPWRHGGLLPRPSGCSSRTGAAGSRIVNVDDPYGRRLAEEFDCLTFSAEGADADYLAGDVAFDAAGATFTSDLRVDGPKAPVRLEFSAHQHEVRADGRGMPGHFNVANALGAFAAAEALGVDPASGRRRARRARRGCRAASSRSTRARASPSSSTTPTPPTRWRTCCGRRGG